MIALAVDLPLPPPTEPVLELVEVTSCAARRTKSGERPSRDLIADLGSVVEVAAGLARLCDELDVFRGSSTIAADGAAHAVELVSTVRELADSLQAVSTRIASRIELHPVLLAAVADIVVRLREIGGVIASRTNDVVLGELDPADYEHDAEIDTEAYLRALRSGEPGPWNASS